MDTLTRANEGGGSGSARQYNRDPKGTSTGGQFTAGSSTSSARAPLTNQGTYKPRTSGSGSTPTAPASSSRFKTLAPGEDNDPQAVAEMQQLLTALGLGNLSSGVYDKDTEAAVMEAQRRLGMKNPNGKANRTLVNKMLAAYDLSPCIKRSEDDDPDTVTRSEGDDDDV